MERQIGSSQKLFLLIIKTAFTQDPFGTGTKLLWISLLFTLDSVDQVQIGSAAWYQNGSTYEGDPIRNCTVPVLNRSRLCPV